MAFAAGARLPEGWVPVTTFWLLDDAGSVVGVSALRHALTPTLLHRGGHVGYYVKESERGRGYGSAILALTLEAAREIGIDRLLVTADSANEPSARVIEGNGGVLEDERPDEIKGVMFRRYWIDLTEPAS